MISKTLKSAVANAENNANLRVDGLVVKEAIVGEGPTMKRMMTRARGSGSTIRKRSSHIRIVLTDEIEIKTRAKKAKQAGGAKKKKTGLAKAGKAVTESRANGCGNSKIRKLIHGTKS